MVLISHCSLPALPRRLLTLAVFAAFAGASLAVRASPQADPAPVSGHSRAFFPAQVMVDVERLNTLRTIGPIRALSAYLANITGSGVTVAVLDTGVSLSHNEFSTSAKQVSGYNAINNTANVADGSGHGTHVAGILAGARDGRGMFGVAYGARILPVKVLDDSGNGSTAYLDRGLRHAIGRASIVNMSLGASSAYDPSALKEAVAAGMLLVAAAGNGSLANPGWPARYAKEAWANNQIIAVGALDISGNIAYYSNRAGDAAAWTVFAPGSGIYSAYPANGYTTMSGTSMATPVVSGAAALIKQRWPLLRASEIANILFMTATDLGDPGIDPIYGRGALNVEQALQPIGALTTTTTSGARIPLTGGTLQISSATSQLWQLAAAGQLRVVGLDAFRRDYSVDLGTTVARPPRIAIAEALGTLDRQENVIHSVLAKGARLSAAYERAPVGGGARLAGFSWRNGNERGGELAFGAGEFTAQAFGAGDFRLREGLSFGAVPALANPYFSLVPAASHLMVARTLAPGMTQEGTRDAGSLRLKFGLLSSGINCMFNAQDDLAGTQSAPRASAALVELSKTSQRFAASFAFSSIRESNAWLGAQSNSGLLPAPQATTQAIQFAAAWLLTPSLALAGQAAYGITPATQQDGLISALTSGRTNAFGVGLTSTDNLQRGDRLSLGVSQPLRTYAGTLALDRATGVREDGSLAHERLPFSMVPQGRELRGEMRYQMPLGAMASTGLTLMLRHEPNHLADAALEKLVVWRYSQSF